MGVEWFRNDKQAVLDELRRGVRPLMATSMASGPLDELVALHIELGVFGALDGLAVLHERAGIDDSLLFRTLAVLPFLPEPGLDPSARALFQGAGRPAPPRLDPSPDPVRRQPAIPPSRGPAGRLAPLPPRHTEGRVPTRRGSGLAPGFSRPPSPRSIAASWSGARSTRSTAAAWATTSAWSAWSASRPSDR